MPPPIHGASMMGKYIHDSKVINSTFDCRYINLTLAKDLYDIGKGSIRKILIFLKQIKNIIQEIRDFQPELCYVTPNAKGAAFYKDFFIVMILKAMKKKVVIHYHNKGVATCQDKILDNLLYKLFFKKLKVIILANTLYSDISKYVNKNDVFICPNGIPEIELPPISHKIINILFLSNMMKEKGVWDLVDSCRILKDKGKQFHCNFIGKWSDISEKDFLNKIKSYNLGNEVTAYGAKYGEEKNKFFQQSDLFIFPTYYNNECFPLVLLEAMQYGITCISTDEGGIPSIIEEGKTGFIINKQQPLTLANRIEYLIDNPEFCQILGKAGKKKFKEEFTLEQFENRLKNILQKIINENKTTY